MSSDDDANVIPIYDRKILRSYNKMNTISFIIFIKRFDCIERLPSVLIFPYQ